MIMLTFIKSYVSLPLTVSPLHQTIPVLRANDVGAGISALHTKDVLCKTVSLTYGALSVTKFGDGLLSELQRDVFVTEVVQSAEPRNVSR